MLTKNKIGRGSLEALSSHSIRRFTQYRYLDSGTVAFAPFGTN